ELGAFAIGLGVNLCRLGVPLPLKALGFAVGFGNDDFALAISIGADLFSRRGTLRAEFIGYAFAFCLHTLVNGFTDFLWQVHPLHAYIQHLNADLTCITVSTLAQDIHDLAAFARNHIMYGALAELGPQSIIDRL